MNNKEFKALSKKEVKKLKRKRNRSCAMRYKNVIGSSIPKPPKDRILREDGKGLVPPKNYQ